MYKRLDRMLTTAALAAVAVSALALLARSFWMLELLTHFRLQYVIVQLPLLLACLWGRRWAVSALLLAATTVNSAVLLPYWPQLQTAIADSGGVELMTVNLYGRNDKHAAFLDLAHRERADVLLLLEYTPDWAEALEPIAAEYPYRLVDGRANFFGIALYSRLPMTEQRVHDLLGAPAIEARLTLGENGTARLIGVHLQPPTSGPEARQRNAQLERLARLVRAQAGPLIVAGDFNLTPYSPLLADWLEETGLTDARRGRGFGMSWPAYLPVVGIPIDLFLLSADFLVLAHYFGPAFGSDHLPVVTRVSLRGQL